MHRDFNRRAAGRNDPVTYTLGQFNVVAVTGRKVATSLGDRNDRLARLQLITGQPIIQIPLQIKRRHFWIIFVHEPLARAQVFNADFFQRNVLTNWHRFGAPTGPLKLPALYDPQPKLTIATARKYGMRQQSPLTQTPRYYSAAKTASILTFRSISQPTRISLNLAIKASFSAMGTAGS